MNVMQRPHPRIVAAALLWLAAAAFAQAQPAADASAAEALLNKSGCTHCHSVSAKKD